MKKQRRYDIYKPSVHGRTWIGSSNNLIKAIAIGEKFGCRVLDCPCCNYEIYDNRLKTDDVTLMIHKMIKK